MAKKDFDLRPVMTRIPEGLRKKLERAAQQRQSSMNSEIVRRLEESFAQAQKIEDVLGGPENAAMLRLIAAEADLLKARYGAGTLGDEKAAAASRIIIDVLTRTVLPTLKSVKLTMDDDSTYTTSQGDKP
jgi:hypothetical protein